MQRNMFLYLVVMVVAACGVLASPVPRQEPDQSQTDSVAEAARKAREKKKTATIIPPKPETEQGQR